MDKGLTTEHLILSGTETTDNVYESLSTISDHSIPDPRITTYKAEEFIVLTPGFQVDTGAVFLAQIDTFPVLGLDYQYFITDHLGNIRVEFKDNGSGTAVAVSNHNYYPFGMSWEGELETKNDYLYNGKEVQKSFDLGYLNYGFRFYDPAIGRFTSVDPLADDFPSWAPYHYVHNNPLRYTDPTGMSADDIILRGSNNTSVTIKTDLIDVSVDASSIVGDLGGNYTFEGDDILVAGLDIVGIVDPTPVSDGLAASIEAKNGNYGMAALSAFGVIPYVGDVAKVGKIPKHLKTINNAIDAVHGNSKLSQKAQHGYEIFNKKTGDVLEYGISGQKRSANQISTGGSPRLNQKLKTKYGNDPNVDGRVIDGNLGNRQNALDWEKGKVQEFRSNNNNQKPPRQIRPN